MTIRELAEYCSKGELITGNEQRLLAQEVIRLHKMIEEAPMVYSDYGHCDNWSHSNIPQATHSAKLIQIEEIKK